MEINNIFENFVSSKNKLILESFLEDFSNFNIKNDDYLNHKKSSYIFRALKDRKDKKYNIIKSKSNYGGLCLFLSDKNCNIIIEEHYIVEKEYCEKIHYPRVDYNQIKYVKNTKENKNEFAIIEYIFNNKKNYSLEINIDNGYESGLLSYSFERKEFFNNSNFPINLDIIKFIIDNLDKNINSLKDMLSLNYDYSSLPLVETIIDNLCLFANKKTSHKNIIGNNDV